MMHRLVFAVLAMGTLASSVAAQSLSPQELHSYACETGELLSCTVLGVIYETGAAGVRDLGRAIDLYERGCAREVEIACLRRDLLQQDGPLAPPPDAFTRVGQVVDADTGAPLANALVELPRLGIRRIADERGWVDLGRLPRGTHDILVRRFGYDEVDGLLPVPWETEFLLLVPPTNATESSTTGAVFGQVTDAVSGEPIANVEVTLLAPNPARTITNPQGRFSFAGVAPGTAEVRLNMLGYMERRGELEVEAGRTVEVNAALSVEPIELDPIEVLVGSPYLQRSGFYHRARGGAGYVFTRREFAASDPIEVSEIFRRTPGVSAERTRQGTRVVTNREIARDRPGACRLRAYLDGMPVIDFDIDQVRPDDVEGIEVYQGLAAPIEYRNLVDPDGTRPCGVVLIWTTRGG